MSASTFPALLADQVRRAGSRPLVTFYDDASGERVELSVVTYENWVAKTAGLLQDELGLERGGRVVVDLPTHWLGPVWLGAAWSVGLEVSPAGWAEGADLVVCGPHGLDTYAGGAAPVVATSLLPMAARFLDVLPAGVLDYGAVVWGQPDAFAAYDPPEEEDPAWRDEAGPRSQAEVLAAAASHPVASPGTRLLTDVNPCSAEGLPLLLGPLLGGGGTVWVRNPDPDGWDRRAAAEQAGEVRRQAPKS